MDKQTTLGQKTSSRRLPKYLYFGIHTALLLKLPPLLSWLGPDVQSLFWHNSCSVLLASSSLATSSKLQPVLKTPLSRFFHASSHTLIRSRLSRGRKSASSISFLRTSYTLVLTRSYLYYFFYLLTPAFEHSLYFLDAGVLSIDFSDTCLPSATFPAYPYLSFLSRPEFKYCTFCP